MKDFRFSLHRRSGNPLLVQCRPFSVWRPPLALKLTCVRHQFSYNCLQYPDLKTNLTLQFPKLVSLFRHVYNCEKRPLASSCLFVRLSARMEQLGFHWTTLLEIWYLSISGKFVEKIQVLLKSNKNNGYFTWRSICIFDRISLGFY